MKEADEESRLPEKLAALSSEEQVLHNLLNQSVVGGQIRHLLVGDPVPGGS